MKKLLVFSILLVVLLSFPGCKKAVTETVKIGAIFSISGANAFLGEPEKNSVNMVIEEYNAKNPNNKVEVVIYDDEGDAAKAQNFAAKLIEEENCLAVIGPSITGSSLKIIDIAKENETPLISCAAAASIVEPVSERKWVFKTAQSDKIAVGKLYGYMKSKNLKNIAIITVSNGYGQSGKTFLENMAPDYGISIIENQTYGAEDSDMKAQLTRIKAAKPDAIICWGTNPGPAYVVRNLKELNITIPLFQSHGVGNSKYIELAGDAVEGTYLVAGKLLIADTLIETDPQKNILTEYAKKYTEKFNEPPSTFGGHGWDSIMLILNAIDSGVIKGSDKEKKDALRNYIENTKNFIGISGVYNFSENDHNGLDENAFAIITVKNGKWLFVE